MKNKFLLQHYRLVIVVIDEVILIDNFFDALYGECIIGSKDACKARIISLEHFSQKVWNVLFQSSTQL